MYKLYNDNNVKVMKELHSNNQEFDLIYADMIYENLDFSWVIPTWELLKPNGIFIIQTDWHSAAEIKVYTSGMKDAFFVNWLCWKNEFGNFPKNKFRQAHDDILIFCKGRNYKFYPEKVQVEKATAKSKGLNKSGRETKLATSVITDICLTTVAKERIKKEDGHCIRWQKPIALMNRLVSPWLDEGDSVLDPYMGSASLGEYCLKNNLNYVGIELDKEPFELATERLYLNCADNQQENYLKEK
jgi:DNA modification methylase